MHPRGLMVAAVAALAWPHALGDPPRPALRPRSAALRDTRLTEVQLEALEPLRFVLDRAKDALDRDVSLYAWLIERERLPEIVGARCGVLLDTPLPLRERGADARVRFDRCDLRCCPRDLRNIGLSRCPPRPPSPWSALEADIHGEELERPPLRGWASDTAFAAYMARIEISHLALQRRQLAESFPDAAELPVRDIVECCAEASGVTLLWCEVGAPDPVPELGDGWNLRQVPVRVVVQGPAISLTAWFIRMLRRPEITAPGDVILRSDEPGAAIVRADVVLRIFVRP